MVALAVAAIVSLDLGTGRCDLAEVNHYYDADGHLQFTQLLAWDWSHQHKRWECQGWKLIEPDTWQCVAGGIVATERGGQRVELRSRFVRETWTTEDPERENQKLFPCGERRIVWQKKSR